MTTELRYVLIVDDHDVVRHGVCRVIEEAFGNMRFVHASNAPDATQVIMSERDIFDVIVTDIFMPDRDGMEVLSELRKNRSTTRVIAISGDGAGSPFQNLKIAEKLGADLTLAKPFTGEMLLNSVNLLMELGPKEPKARTDS